MVGKEKLLEYTKEIVVAKMANTTLSPNKDSGKLVAEFMQEIFNKLVELDN